MKIASLSPSMVKTYNVCGRKFLYQYGFKLPYLPNFKMACGSAIHLAAKENYFQKISTGKDLHVGLLTDLFAEDLEYRDVDWSEQSLDKTKDEGVKTLRAYMQKIAPNVRPAHVEHAWTMKIKGRDWVISGMTDLITDKDMVIELKTTGRKVSKSKPDHRFQAGTYVAAWRQQTGLEIVQARIDYAIRGREDMLSFPAVFGDSNTKHILTTFDQVAKGIQADVWIPNRTGSYLCSRKYCSFWNECEKDCGGRVRD